jgi:Zn-dependent peptidase ImmA (M78 family)
MYSADRTIKRLAEIQAEARELQIDIYKRRRELWNGYPPADLIDVFEPGVALRQLKYSLEDVSSLGVQLINGVRSEIAATIDTEKKLVSVARGFPATTKRFSVAHELAHAVLHPDMRILHRDLPLEKSGVVRDWREIEANRFASEYLMPRKTVEEMFYQRFDIRKFELTETSAFALCGRNAHDVISKYRDLRQLTLCIAGTPRFGTRYFDSLSEKFKVSTLAMAIRLEELNLVSWDR